MKKLLSIFTLTLLATTSLVHASGCHSGVSRSELKRIKGVYEGCAPSIHGSNYYDYYKVTITDRGDYTRYLQLHAASDCSDSPINKINYQYQIKKPSKVSSHSGQRTYNVDLKVKRTDVQMVNSGYYPYLNNIAECGFTDWSASTIKNVTGKTII